MYFILRSVNVTDTPTTDGRLFRVCINKASLVSNFFLFGGRYLEHRIECYHFFHRGKRFRDRVSRKHVSIDISTFFGICFKQTLSLEKTLASTEGRGEGKWRLSPWLGGETIDPGSKSTCPIPYVSLISPKKNPALRSSTV